MDLAPTVDAHCHLDERNKRDIHHVLYFQYTDHTYMADVDSA